MNLVDSIAAGNCRNAVFDAYTEGRAHAARFGSQLPPHWWGLCDALSRHCLSHASLLPEPALWAELAPFLLVADERASLDLLAEYAVYKACPAEANVERLGAEINPALHRLDLTDGRVVAFLDDAMVVYRPAWLALLSYETFCWVRRALRAAREVPRGQRVEWCGRGGPLWLKRGPGEVESEALGSLQD